MELATIIMEKVDPERPERLANQAVGAEVFTLEHAAMYYLVRAAARTMTYMTVATIFMVVCTASYGGPR